MYSAVINENKDQAPAKKQWTDHETSTLLHIWGHSEMQAKMLRCRHKRKLWQEIAGILTEKGIKRDWQQCFYKIHNMTVEHQKFKRGRKKSMPFVKHFGLFDRIIGSKPKPVSSSGTTTITTIANAICEPFSDDPDTMTSSNLLQIMEKQQQAAINSAGAIAFSKVELASNSDSEPLVENSPCIDNAARSAFSPHPNGLSSTSGHMTPEYPEDQSNNSSLAGQPATNDHHQHHNVFLSSLSLLLDKSKEMQRESEERFYAFEEKRLRLQFEGEQSRHQRAMSHDAQRNQFCAQLITNVIKSYFEAGGGSTANGDGAAFGEASMLRSMLEKNRCCPPKL